MGAVRLFSCQVHIISLSPQLTEKGLPPISGKASYRHVTARYLFLKRPGIQYPCGCSRVLAIKLIETVLLKADQGIGIAGFQVVVFSSRFHRQRQGNSFFGCQRRGFLCCMGCGFSVRYDFFLLALRKNRSKPSIINLCFKACPIQPVRFRGIVLQKGTPDVFSVHLFYTQMNVQLTINVPVQFIPYMIGSASRGDVLRFLLGGRRIRCFFLCFQLLFFRFRNRLGSYLLFFFICEEPIFLNQAKDAALHPCPG